MGRIRNDFKQTLHHYKGFTIHGGQRITEGGYVLCGRHFIEGVIARNYSVKKDGRYVWNPNDIIQTLKDAKELIDDYIQRKSIQ